jgi:hypothetical protein
MTTWKRIYPDFAVEFTHAPPKVICDAEIVPLLRQGWDLAAATEGLMNNPEVKLAKMVEDDPEGVLLDVGGIMWSGRHEYDFVLDGLKVKIPAIDVGVFLNMAETAKSEVLSGHLPTTEYVSREVYRIHTFMDWRLLLSPKNRLALFMELKKIEKEAAAIATVENDRFNKDLVDKPHPNVRARRRPVGPIGKG